MYELQYDKRLKEHGMFGYRCFVYTHYQGVIVISKTLVSTPWLSLSDHFLLYQLSKLNTWSSGRIVIKDEHLTNECPYSLMAHWCNVWFCSDKAMYSLAVKGFTQPLVLRYGMSEI